MTFITGGVGAGRKWGVYEKKLRSVGGVRKMLQHVLGVYEKDIGEIKGGCPKKNSQQEGESSRKKKPKHFKSEIVSISSKVVESGHQWVQKDKECVSVSI